MTVPKISSGDQLSPKLDWPLSRREEMLDSAAHAPTALYFRGMGVLGSAAGRSLSLMELSTAFSPCGMHVKMRSHAVETF